MADRLKWVDGSCFLGETNSGHALIMDGGIEHGGKNRGARPMELLLHGTAGCVAYDVLAIAKKAKQDIRDLWIDIESTQATTSPQVYTRINFHLVISGKQIQNEEIERAIQLASEKYCSASVMISQVTNISYTYEIREAN